jgi:hypothetical protein
VCGCGYQATYIRYMSHVVIFHNNEWLSCTRVNLDWVGTVEVVDVVE